MKKIKKSAKFWLCIALALCLISALGASLIQSDFGRVTVKDLRFETASGHQMSALLFVPDTATAENPAPTIICSHGEDISVTSRDGKTEFTFTLAGVNSL